MHASGKAVMVAAVVAACLVGAVAQESVVVHPKDGSAYNSTGEYRGGNTPPRTENPPCCNVCPSSCDASGSNCFKKCFRVCGEKCRVAQPKAECTLGVDCGMSKCSAKGSAGPKPQFSRDPLPATGSTGSTGATGGAVVVQKEGETEVQPAVEANVVSEDEHKYPAHPGPAPTSTAPQANDPRDPEYQSAGEGKDLHEGIAHRDSLARHEAGAADKAEAIKRILEEDAKASKRLRASAK